jgi:hypothetical protein
MNRFVFCLCVLLPPVSSALCRAGDAKLHPDDAAIEKVVAASMEAARKGDWGGYADLVHPESLQDYKGMWLPVLQAAAKEGPEKQADLLALFDGATELKSVLALKPKEFFVSSMKGMAAQTTVPKQDTAKADEKILGTVREGDDLAHVLIRTRAKYQQTDVNRIEVVTVKRSDSEWRIVLPEAVRVMAEAFRRGLQPGPLKSGSDTVPADPGKQRRK